MADDDVKMAALDFVPFHPAIDDGDLAAHKVVFLSFTETVDVMARYYARHPITAAISVLAAALAYVYLQSFVIALAVLVLPCLLFLYALPIHVWITVCRKLPDWKQLSDFWKGRNQLFFVKTPSGEIVASVGWIEDKDGKSAELVRINVKRDYRGRGLGRKIVEFAVRKCREVGYSHVWLGTSTFQQPAHRLYERCGFVVYECHPIYIFVFIPMLSFFKLRFDLKTKND